MRSISSGRPVEVRSPDSVRPWQYVLEPLSGYLTLAAKMMASDDPALLSAWNFGPMVGNEIPVKELVEMVIRDYGEGTWKDTSDPGQRHEARLLRLAIDKAVWDLGWRPRWGPDRAVDHLAKWYRKFYHGGEGQMRAQCEHDIQDYENSPFIGEVVPLTEAAPAR